MGSDMVCNRVHKVSFTQTRFPVNKQGIKNFAGVFGNCFRRRISKLTACARYERIKSTFFFDGCDTERSACVFFGVHREKFAAVYDEAEVT